MGLLCSLSPPELGLESQSPELWYLFILHDSLIHDLHLYVSLRIQRIRDPQNALKTIDMSPWWPHSPRTCCWLAYDTFIIINGKVSEPLYNTIPRSVFRWITLWAFLFVYLFVLAAMESGAWFRRSGTRRQGGLYLLQICHDLLLKCKESIKTESGVGRHKTYS